MKTRKTLMVALGALVLIGGLTFNTNTADAGIRGILSVYNQSAKPYHIFVEGQRIGTIVQGQTMNIPVQDWNGPTQLVAVQAGSRGTVQFQQMVRTCQYARWELHTHWEKLNAIGGPEHVRPGMGMPGHVRPPMQIPARPPMRVPGHGCPHHGFGHVNAGPALVGQGAAMVAHGVQRNDPARGTEIAAGILTILAGAAHHR